MPSRNSVKLGYPDQGRINQNSIDLDQVAFRKYPPGVLKAKHSKPVQGFDTETLDGYCRLIASGDGTHCLTDGIGPILRYLCKKPYRASHNFFFNLRYDVQAVVKYLPRASLQELYDTKKTAWQDFDLFYIPEKIFKITHDRHPTAFYDVAQFYEETLDNAAKRYLGEGKALGGLDRVKIGTSASYWSKHKAAIVKYCLVDADLTRRLGEVLNDTAVKDIVFYPRKYTSKAGISKDYFRTHCTFPDIREIPRWALSMAMASYAGGRFEVVKKGHFRNAWSIDIKSAYPHWITRLPDLRTGRWGKVYEMNPDALLGFYLIKVYVPPMPLGPLPVKVGSPIVTYPVGSWTTYCSKTELETYQGDCDMKVIRGVEYYDRNPTYPFADRIKMLYDLKAATPKDHFAYDLYKKIMNSLYGAFYEKVATETGYYAGLLFNPIYAAWITAGTRTQLWGLIRRYPKAVIGSATDGLLLDVDPEIGKSNDLGQWSEDGHGVADVIRSGLYRIGDKIRNRGLKKVTRLITPHGAYPDLFSYMVARPKLKVYPITVDRPLNLGECLTQVKSKSPALINVWSQYEYRIDINQDLKRLWDDKFKNGGDLLDRSIDSRPILYGVGPPSKG
jgi:hypothetical protein